MAFPVEKRVDLSFLGAKWQGAELVFSGLSFKDTRELAHISDKVETNNVEQNYTFTTELLANHFISGKAWNGTAIVEINKDDIGDLPVDAVNKSVEVLAGQADPKS